ncbi:sigma 54-interacting transcriptional regulator [Escherichia albertii]|uniref:sigma 54-interacting transcriptional regulator n=1 Tax=Escherichia albertii TaxID=208962 RepID=UPI0002BA1110|nr:sigma-54-dependent Fis family transcriptional regulator [Escherichia albertii]EFX6078087.1 sigma-54-dependent Fis family transcriptional regulator [Shigella boydii]MCZ8872016.1 sigma 54-interacting transcriptional regulator [Escherichia albertii]
MSNITLIAADRTLFSLVHKLSMQLFPEIIVVRGILGEGVAVAANQIRQGAEILISRGATAKAIREAFPSFIHVTIQRSAFDYISALNLAQSIGSPIAAIALPHLVEGLTATARVLNLHLRLYSIFKEEEVEPIILRAVHEGAAVVVGSSSTGIAAARLKVPHVVVQSGEESIIAAMTEAQRIYEMIRMSRSKSSLLHAAVNAADNAIVALDRLGRVVEFNFMAEHIMGINVSDALSKPCSTLWPTFDFDMAIRSELPLLPFSSDETENVIGQARPVKLDEEVVGVVVNFQRQNCQSVLTSNNKKHTGTGHIARANFRDIHGSSSTIQRTIALAKQYAKTDGTVFIVGETGTGKELFAQSIHNSSTRATKAFVAVNCSALPGTLLESELFGYVPGAFTGASNKGKPGLFEQADGGTIFLDEITEIEPHIQTKLLRVLQEKQVMRLGSDTVTPFDVRVIAASNEDIPRQLELGKFRSDLYYRLNVLMLHLPPLRERQEDIPLLCRYFLRRYLPRITPIPGFTSGAMRELCEWSWQGNIREMQNIMTRVATTVRGKLIDRETIKYLLEGSVPPENDCDFSQEKEEIIRKALVEAGGKKGKAAASIGMSRTTFWRKTRKTER